GDEHAIPALLQLLRHIERFQYSAERMAESLKRRGRVEDALAVLQPQVEVPRGVHDNCPDQATGRRALALRTAAHIAPASTHAFLNALYCDSGDPAEDARRLMTVWNMSGIGGVARSW